MSQYNFLQAFYMSFYSQDLYRDVAKHWSGKAFIYLILLLTMCWIGAVIQIQRDLERFYIHTVEAGILQLPKMEINKGSLRTPENRPYLIKDPKTDRLLLIIDTSGQYTTLDGSEARLLVTANTLTSRKNARETITREISPIFDGVTVNPVRISEVLKQFVKYAWLAIFVIGLTFSIAYRILQALIYSLLGRIFSAISASGVNYGTILPITLVALTPAIVLSTVLDILHIVFPSQFFTYFIITMLYIAFGIRANKI